MLKYRQSREMPVKEKKSFRTLFMFTIILMILMIFSLSILQNDDPDSVTESTLITSEIRELKLSKFQENFNAESPNEFLLDSEFCKIPNLNPFSVEAMSVFKSVKPENCSKIPPLTSIEYDNVNNRHKIIINLEHKKYYASWFRNEITCCYQRITRNGTGSNSDNEFSLSSCIGFESGHQLNEKDDFILVTCKKYKNIILIRRLKAEIYKNAHAMIINKKEHNVKPEIHNKTNILFIGIDSISRLHLIRAMPLTYNYLREKQWIEMKAYNKIGDNTFPNFMAILAGVNETYAFDKCSTKETGGINKCKLLWDNFKDQKYTTAYAEDSIEISTFNFYKKGFEKQPTDFYFRYFALAAEKYLPTTHDKPWNTNCIGYQHYADYIYNYAFDFASQYKNSPYFGFFWTNSFSHDDINLPSGYDLRMRNHLRKFEEEKVLDNTIVIFVSDHGMRFGDIRNFFTGWLEERMPFLYFYIPENFKKRYPNLIENLEINRERLTTPFDVYLTMKHVLQLSGSEQDFTAISCPDCQSLFKEISINRTCADAGIPENYCTCSPYEEIDHSLPIVKNIANFIVNVLNALLSSHKKCAQLKLENVISARELTYEKHKDFLVTLNVLPSKGKFEATVRKTSVENSFELLGDISRINRYGDQSKCIRDAHLRKYCYCI